MTIVHTFIYTANKYQIITVNIPMVSKRKKPILLSFEHPIIWVLVRLQLSLVSVKHKLQIS